MSKPKMGRLKSSRRFLRQYTQLYEMSVADEYADDGVSGKLPLSERPEGRRLLQDAEGGG